MGKGAVREDLGAEGAVAEEVAEVVEELVVRGESGVSGGLQEPGTARVLVCVAGEAAEAGGGEPIGEGGEPGVEGFEVVGENFEVGDADRQFGEAGGFEDRLWAGEGGGAWGLLGVFEVRRHCRGGIDEPGAEVGGGVGTVEFGAGGVGGGGDQGGGGERGDEEGEAEKGVGVGAGGLGVGVGGGGGGLGVEVVGGAGCVGDGEGGEGCWGLGEGGVGCGEDAVVVDGGDVGVGGGGGGGLGEEVGREEGGGGLGEEGAAGEGHGEVCGCFGREYTPSPHT